MKSNEPLQLSAIDISTAPLRIKNAESSFTKLFSLKLPYLIVVEKCSPNLDECFLSTTQVAPGFHVHFNLSKKFFYNSILRKRTLHRHDYFEFMYVIEGEVRQNIENIYYNYSKGECCLLNPNTRHCEDVSTDYQVVFIAISTEYLQDIVKYDIMYLPDGSLQNHTSAIYNLITEKNDNKTYYGKEYLDFYPVAPTRKQIEDCTKIFDDMIIETLNQKPGCNLMVKALFTRFFSMLESSDRYSMSHIHLNSSSEEFLFIRIAHILEANRGRISRAELGKTLNYNSDYLNRIVKKYTGMSLLEYGQTIFLKEAEQLLTKTERNISEIIKELGFSNRSYFYRIFKDRYGITPNEYRDKYSIKNKLKVLD